jgi:hypothetical protein
MWREGNQAVDDIPEIQTLTEAVYDPTRPSLPGFRAQGPCQPERYRDQDSAL